MTILLFFSFLRSIVIKINDSHYNHKVIWAYTLEMLFSEDLLFLEIEKGTTKADFFVVQKSYVMGKIEKITRENKVP